MPGTFVPVPTVLHMCKHGLCCLIDLMENTEAHVARHTKIQSCCVVLLPQEDIEEMCKYVEHPLIFPLSNPSSKAEITAPNAYEWSHGRAIFASGLPLLISSLCCETRTRALLTAHLAPLSEVWQGLHRCSCQICRFYVLGADGIALQKV